MHRIGDFFFQAQDGIRDWSVTGVQTCALPIFSTGADLQEVDNAVNQATKEVAQRYDFKGSKASLAFDRAKAVLTLVADDDFKMKALFDVLQSKLIKRNVPVKNLELGAVTPAAND